MKKQNNLMHLLQIHILVRATLFCVLVVIGVGCSSETDISQTRAQWLIENKLGTDIDTMLELEEMDPKNVVPLLCEVVEKSEPMTPKGSAAMQILATIGDEAAIPVLVDIADMYPNLQRSWPLQRQWHIEMSEQPNGDANKQVRSQFWSLYARRCIVNIVCPASQDWPGMKTSTHGPLNTLKTHYEQVEASLDKKIDEFYFKWREEYSGEAR
jgi:hypothetical protein